MSLIRMHRDVNALLQKDLFANGSSRLALARREKIRAQLEIQQILEPKAASEPVTETYPDGSTHTYTPWTWRRSIEERIATLQKVIDEETGK